MATVKRFEDLECWQLARRLNRSVFSLTQKELFKKDFRFRDQIRAAAGSVMDNIAEGFGRGGNKEMANQLSISIGSANEVQSQLYRAKDFEYIGEEEFQRTYELAQEVIGKTGKLIEHLRQTEHRGQKFKTRN